MNEELIFSLLLGVIMFAVAKFPRSLRILLGM